MAAMSGDDRPWMSPQASAGLAWLLCGASLTLGLFGLVLESLNGHQITDSAVVGIALLAITYPLVGAVVAARRPRNPLGWIFCVIGISYGLTVTGEAYASYTLRTAPGSLPGGELMSWLGNWAWAPGLGLLMTFALLLFPDGRLPSRRWRPVAWLSAASIAIICGPGAVWSWPQRGLALLKSAEEGLENAPVGVGFLVQAGLPLMLLCGLASVVALLVRFRRSRGVERQQLKWFAFAGAVSFAGLVLIVVHLSTGGSGRSARWSPCRSWCPCQSPRASRSSGIGCTTSTGSSAAPWSTGSSPRCWARCTPAWSWSSGSYSAGSATRHRAG